MPPVHKVDVLQVLPDLNLGGVQRVVTLLSSQSHANGVRTSVATLTRSHASILHDKLSSVGIETYCLDAGGRFDRAAFSRLQLLIRELEPRVVHFHGHVYRYVAPLVRQFPNVEFLFTLHEEMSWAWFQLDNVLRWLLVVQNPRIHVSAVSVASQRSAHRTIGLTADHVIANAVEPPGVGRPSAQVSTCTQATGIGRPYTFCTVSRLVPRKGHSTLVDAATLLVRKHPLVRFLLIGDGRLRKPLELKVERAGLRDHFEFLGETDDPYSMIAECDALVHPSETEASSLCCMEAMHMGLPIIATDAGGIPEVVSHGITGLLVPPRHPFELAEAMGSFVSSPEWAARLGHNGQERAKDSFSPGRLCEEYLALYKSLFPRLHAC